MHMSINRKQGTLIMADVDKPHTHVENDKEADLPRTQPESPKHDGIDPLTEGDTMYPSEDTKAESEKLAKKSLKDEPTEVDESYLPENQSDAGDGNPEPARDEPSASTRQRTEPVKAEGKVQPQTARPANTNDSAVADGSTEPDADDTNAATGEAKSENRKEAESNGSGTSAPTSAKASAKADPAKQKSPADK